MHYCDHTHYWFKIRKIILKKQKQHKTVFKLYAYTLLRQLFQHMLNFIKLLFSKKSTTVKEINNFINLNNYRVIRKAVLS